VYYSRKSGTSMAAPHISGVVALMLEANPALDWRGVKQILEQTATNITGRAAWEVGAGYVNTYAAVQAAMQLGQFGSTPNSARTFNARAQTSVASNQQVSFNFSPVGSTGEVRFDVAAGISLVSASANLGSNTLALVLIDPAGRRYGSSIALPVLGQNIAVSAPGMAGTWTLTARGIGSVSGTNLDPAQVTNGYGAPGTVMARIKQVRTDGFTGLNDIANHPARGFIEYGVSRRLLDSDANGQFRPDALIKRRELADFAVMGLGVRQSDPLAGPSFVDIARGSALFPLAEAVGARGAVLRDTFHAHDPLLTALAGGRFEPEATVSREQLAYTLVQSLGLQQAARAHSGDVSVAFDGKRIVLSDQSQISPALRGYVQLALDAGLIPATFSVSQGPFDLQPVITASFGPGTAVTRAAYAAAAARLAMR
jgi:serine protease AprX